MDLPQFEQKRFRSGTTPGTIAASGSCGGSGGRARGTPPSARLAVRPLRDDPVRVERELRELRVLRALFVEGVRPEPVRVDAVPGAGVDRVDAVAPAIAAAAAPGAAAMPHTLQ